jgi:hypothetical protein
MSRAGGCIICDAAAGGLFCPRHGQAYDRAAGEFSGDEQSVMRWIADAARKNQSAVHPAHEGADPRRRSEYACRH